MRKNVKRFMAQSEFYPQERRLQYQPEKTEVKKFQFDELFDLPFASRHFKGFRFTLRGMQAVFEIDADTYRKVVGMNSLIFEPHYSNPGMFNLSTSAVLSSKVYAFLTWKAYWEVVKLNLQ